ncbi:hypothetical protein EJ02DRAFT_460934 [Clathrospora elynae]|uniref:Peptidase C14 caspase domain-containing protein n=1 Tax=Clathrospora elynae TaxID=706981 RepID=A0A6A5S568_9PLEO|nr:hypothetical protein EJ02DRAFT_460934 [Clathrospora elynae]
MALSFSSDTTAQIMDTATDIAPRNANPLPNKVIHADIRIQSIEDDPTLAGSPSQSNELVVQSRPSGEDAVYQEKAAEMQNWWTEAIAKNMDLPDGYSKVAVLLIKWADELDELKTGQEAQELAALFRDRFNYHTKTVKLNVRKKPQHQLDSHISEFIRDHDGPHNLLIVYYTGHGVYHEDKKYLELTGSLNPLLGKGFFKDARANWNVAEDRLKRQDVDGDVLTILDTCYSSNLVKSGKEEEQKKFELLSACAIDQTTASPGKNSFTRALIDAIAALLKEDGDRPISTFRLNQRINIDKRRLDTPSQLWARGQSSQHNEQHILFAPLKPQKLDALHDSKYRPKPKGFLTLRFGLRDASLNQQQIDFMTKTLAKAFNIKALVGVRRVDWLEINPAPPLSHFERVTSVVRVIKQWKKVIIRNKEERESQQRGVDKGIFREVDVESANGSSQKRAYEGVDEQSDAKRRYLEAEQPPSPPVSHSSHLGYDA